MGEELKTQNKKIQFIDIEKFLDQLKGEQTRAEKKQIVNIIRLQLVKSVEDLVSILQKSNNQTDSVKIKNFIESNRDVIRQAGDGSLIFANDRINYKVFDGKELEILVAKAADEHKIWPLSPLKIEEYFAQQNLLIDAEDCTKVCSAIIRGYVETQPTYGDNKAHNSKLSHHNQPSAEKHNEDHAILKASNKKMNVDPLAQMEEGGAPRTKFQNPHATVHKVKPRHHDVQKIITAIKEEFRDLKKHVVEEIANNSATVASSTASATVRGIVKAKGARVEVGNKIFVVAADHLTPITINKTPQVGNLRSQIINGVKGVGSPAKVAAGAMTLVDILNVTNTWVDTDGDVWQTSIHTGEIVAKTMLFNPQNWITVGTATDIGIFTAVGNGLSKILRFAGPAAVVYTFAAHSEGWMKNGMDWWASSQQKEIVSITKATEKRNSQIRKTLDQKQAPGPYLQDPKYFVHDAAAELARFFLWAAHPLYDALNGETGRSDWGRIQDEFVRIEGIKHKYAQQWDHDVAAMKDFIQDPREKDYFAGLMAIHKVRIFAPQLMENQCVIKEYTARDNKIVSHQISIDEIVQDVIPVEDIILVKEYEFEDSKTKQKVRTFWIKQPLQQRAYDADGISVWRANPAANWLPLNERDFENYISATKGQSKFIHIVDDSNSPNINEDYVADFKTPQDYIKEKAIKAWLDVLDLEFISSDIRQQLKKINEKDFIGIAKLLLSDPDLKNQLNYWVNNYKERDVDSYFSYEYYRYSNYYQRLPYAFSKKQCDPAYDQLRVFREKAPSTLGQIKLFAGFKLHSFMDEMVTKILDPIDVFASVKETYFVDVTYCEQRKYSDYLRHLVPTQDEAAHFFAEREFVQDILLGHFKTPEAKKLLQESGLAQNIIQDQFKEMVKERLLRTAVSYDIYDRQGQIVQQGLRKEDFIEWYQKHPEAQFMREAGVTDRARCQMLVTVVRSHKDFGPTSVDMTTIGKVLDHYDPENVLKVSYEPETGLYVFHTLWGDVITETQSLKQVQHILAKNPQYVLLFDPTDTKKTQELKALRFHSQLGVGIVKIEETTLPTGWTTSEWALSAQDNQDKYSLHDDQGNLKVQGSLRDVQQYLGSLPTNVVIRINQFEDGKNKANQLFERITGQLINAEIGYKQKIDYPVLDPSWQMTVVDKIFAIHDSFHLVNANQKLYHHFLQPDHSLMNPKGSLTTAQGKHRYRLDVATKLNELGLGPKCQSYSQKQVVGKKDCFKHHE